MSTKNNQFASPPCFAHELDGLYDGYDGYDEDCWRDVQSWRISQRKHLLHLRKQLPENQRAQEIITVTSELERLLVLKNPAVVGVYWPIFSEMNFFDWLEEKAKAGLHFCLPVVTQRNHPLEFCYWKPREPMISGEWGIPVPSEKKFAEPDLIIVPLLGVDSKQHRLGYGGGYYDHTLAAIRKEVFTVGVGFSTAMIPTIFPQPHDVPLRAVILGQTGQSTLKGP